jgi:ArsR family transcriptional regulator, arsenate/arsenite/antimonite-responsive transcriptional repressor
MRETAYVFDMEVISNPMSRPTRRYAPDFVRSGIQQCACGHVARLDASQSGMSGLKYVIGGAGVVSVHQDAQWVRYRRNPENVPETGAVIEAVLAAEGRFEKETA